ncbi:MAG TPA: M3 family metallopeptidase, partial [Longimicrobium sp.]|nr:M3 family metallopeptidase [Longimicrobium sp.]
MLRRDSLITRTGALALATAAAGCAPTVQNQPSAPPATVSVAAAPAPAASSNPLLAPWTGPYGGVPPFDQVRVEHFKPALEAAMAENLAEIDRIARNPAAPTFENTLVELERAGRTLNRVATAYSIWSGNMNGPEFQVVEREMAPRLAAFGDRITQNEALFRRIEAVYNAPARTSWTPEQQRLAWRYYTNFVRAGARLDATKKTRLSEINQRLAGLYTKFSQNVLADETNQVLVIENAADLAGLPQSLRDAAAAAATAKGMQGRWVITNTRSSVDPFLTYSERRDLRERAWKMFVDRGEAGETDNNPTIAEILKLRAERASLLGYPTHAHWRLENAMA